MRPRGQGADSKQEGERTPASLLAVCLPAHPPACLLLLLLLLAGSTAESECPAAGGLQEREGLRCAVPGSRHIHTYGVHTPIHPSIHTSIHTVRDMTRA